MIKYQEDYSVLHKQLDNLIERDGAAVIEKLLGQIDEALCDEIQEFKFDYIVVHESNFASNHFNREDT